MTKQYSYELLTGMLIDPIVLQFVSKFLPKLLQQHVKEHQTTAFVEIRFFSS